MMWPWRERDDTPLPPINPELAEFYKLWQATAIQQAAIRKASQEYLGWVNALPVRSHPRGME